MITRVVNGVEFDVNIEAGNEIYFDESFVKKCKSSGINDILIALYNEKKSYTPESLFLELTGRCNFNCPFCYIHSCSKAKEAPLIDLKRLKQDLGYLINQGLVTCTISGGECLLHPQFFELYTFLKENGIIVTILSNLSLLSDDLLKLFSRLPPYKIDVTIYAVDEDAMHKITGQSTVKPSVILDNILKLKHAGINVTCKTPFNTLTQNQIELIQDWCCKHDIPYFYSMEIFDSYEGDDMSSYGMPPEEIFNDRIHSKLKKYSDVSSEFGIKRSFHCKGGQYGLFISYDYVLRPCMPFYAVKSGNFPIESSGIASALNAMQKFINTYKNKELTFCKGCYNFQLCDLCIIDQLSNHKSSSSNYCRSLSSYKLTAFKNKP